MRSIGLRCWASATAALCEPEFGGWCGVFRDALAQPVETLPRGAEVYPRVAVLGRVPAERRMLPGEGDVARAIERASPEKLDEQSALIAHHWEHAEEALEAARWYRRAALWSVRSNPLAGTASWQKVRELLDRAEETSETIALGVEARGQLLISLGRGGAMGGPELETILDEGAQLASRSGDARVRIRFLHGVGAHHIFTGAGREGVSSHEEARDLAAEIGDPDLQVSAL